MPKQTLPITVDVSLGEIVSAHIVAPFDRAQTLLEANGFRIISLPENAYLRVQGGKDAGVSRHGNFTREGILYIPGKESRLVRNSPILYSAEEATKAHWQGNEFYPTHEQIEKSLEDSVTFPDRNIKIPTNRFEEEELTLWAFPGYAEEYGSFLREAGIKEMPVFVVDKDYANKQEKPFSGQLWFSDIGSSSRLDDCKNLNYPFGRVRGLRREKIG